MAEDIQAVQEGQGWLCFVLPLLMASQAEPKTSSCNHLPQQSATQTLLRAAIR